jgi:hypothetical protein
MFFTKDIMRRSSFKKIILLLLLILPGMRLVAQFDVFPGGKRQTENRELVSEEVDTTGKISKFGPNRLFYLCPYGGLGTMPMPQVYGAQTNWWSTSLTYGIRSKLKLFYWNALVLDVAYRYDRYSIRQNTPKLSPLIAANHVRERISLHNFSVAFCDRINFRRRGNVMGNWLDLGVYADHVFRSANVFVDRHYDSNSASGFSYKVKTRIVGLPYIDKLNYGFAIRVGGDYYCFYAQYRVNSLFTVETPNNRDLPKLMLGVTFAGWE